MVEQRHDVFLFAKLVHSERGLEVRARAGSAIVTRTGCVAAASRATVVQNRRGDAFQDQQMASGSWLWDNAKWAALALLAALGVQFGGPVWAWISKTLGLKTLASMMVVPLKLSSGAASSQWQAAQKRSMNVKIMKACKEPVIRTTSELLWRLNQLDGMACLGKTQLEKTKPNAAAEIKALVDGPETRKKLQEQTIWQNSDKASGDGADTLEAKITGSEFWLQQAKEIKEEIDAMEPGLPTKPALLILLKLGSIIMTSLLLI